MSAHYTKEFKEQVRQTYLAGGVSYRELALECGASYTAVYAWCNPEFYARTLVQHKRKRDTPEAKEKARKFREGWYAKNKDRKLEKNREWQRQNPIRYWAVIAARSAKLRAVSKSLPFSITVDDIVSAYPTDGLCPVFRTAMTPANGYVHRQSSPSLDRIIPALGYVPNNIAVISVRANQTKNDATVEELTSLTKWLQNVISERNIV